ncbi:sensor histidine kinase [Virgibacillus sp. FSP13]
MLKEKSYSLIGFLGLLFLTYGELFPTFIPNWSLFISDNINESIVMHDSGQLLVTAFAFIAKYVLIYFFIYFGSMLLAHAITRQVESIRFSLLFISITMIAITLFNQIYHEHFSYLGHMVTIGTVILLNLYIPKQKHFYFIFSIVLFLILMASEWLQLIPALSQFGFGTNDMAVSIKIADSYFTENRLYNTLATIFFVAFLTIAVILSFLIHLVNKQFYTLKKYQQQEEELKETRIALIESSVYQEINTLVHDLKTPLVTVEGLTSLINLKMQPTTDTYVQEYFNRMDKSLEKMKDMISEILYENIKQQIPVQELLEYVTSHLDLNEQQVDLVINVQENVPPIYVNKIRFSRAISNILENAITSFSGKAGYIHIHVKRVGSGILLRIQDNGPGIQSSHLKNIWQDGFSTKNSSGIGLSFVKKVVENHCGSITVNSIPGSHTQMNILLPIHKEGEKVNGYNHSNSR